MASITASTVLQRVVAPRRWRVIRENLTAYAFLAPAGTIIFLFGVFPVLFAFFVSLHRWRRFPGDYRGLDSYVKALGDLAYVVFFWLALGILLASVYWLWRLWRESRDERQALLYLVPGALAAAGILAFTNWFFVLLPVVLDVPNRLRGQTVVEGAFVNEFFASFSFPQVLAANDEMLVALAVALASLIIFLRLVRTSRSNTYVVMALSVFMALAVGALLMQLTLSEIQAAVAEAQAAGEALPIWSQIILISTGAALMGVAVWLWQRGVADYDDRRFLLRAFMVILAIIGAYLLITQLPTALADADNDVLQGFNVTVMYSAFSVPLQLTLGLGLAVLLFQNIKGKSFFRIVYFLPYITPFVATSAIFALLFSHRSGSPANQLLAMLNVERQSWLLEPTGIFRLLFGAGVPDVLVGPGLALVVIIVYNIWVYAGYSTVIFLAGLGNIPPELYEAARIDGANKWHQFRHVTLPLLSPTTFFLMLIATIGTFQAFTQIFLMRRPGAFKAVDTINIYIYEEIRNAANPDYAYGAAMAFVLFGVILILTLIQNRIIGRRVFYG
jgi:ABC-type sugar transport system permease subunit